MFLLSGVLRRIAFSLYINIPEKHTASILRVQVKGYQLTKRLARGLFLGKAQQEVLCCVTQFLSKKGTAVTAKRCLMNCSCWCAYCDVFGCLGWAPWHVQTVGWYCWWEEVPIRRSVLEGNLWLKGCQGVEYRRVRIALVESFCIGEKSLWLKTFAIRGSGPCAF
jgi:hypothetical protein